MKKEFTSKSAGILIGWNGYPNINAGVLTPQERIIKQGPKKWVANNSSMNEIINYCTKLIHSRSKTNIKESKGITESVRAAALTSKPLSTEVTLSRVPELRINYDVFNQPIGPSVEIEKLVITDNPVIKQSVRKAYYDTDLKANDAINYLTKNKISELEISALLSAGTLGLDSKRKLVPTKWAITATDDLISKEQLVKIRSNTLLNKPLIFHSELLNNKFTILLKPSLWSYELIEEWPGSTSTDYENLNDRKTYASSTAGGYYASRLPVTEWLMINKKQASAIVLRQVSKEYNKPLGVWVVREGMRKAIQNFKEFDNLQQAIKHFQEITNYDLRKSKTLNNNQVTLKEY